MKIKGNVYMKRQSLLLFVFSGTISLYAQQARQQSAPFDMYGKYAVQLDCVETLSGKTEYKYSFEGENLKLTKLIYSVKTDDKEWANIDKTESTYDLNGNVIDSLHTVYYKERERWYGDFHNTYKYDEQGLLTEERTFYNPSITTYAYDEKNRVSEVIYKIEKDDNIFLPVTKTSYLYDENDSIICKTEADYDSGKYKNRTITDFTFNEKGLRTSSKETWFYMNGGGSFTGTCEELKYDENGHLVFYEKYDSDQIWDKKEYTFDEQGRERSHTFYLPLYGGELVPSEVYQIDYDEYGNVCLETKLTGQLSEVYDIADKWERTYNNDGNITKYIHSSRYSTNDEWNCVEYWTKEYDSQGRETRWSNIMSYLDQPHTIIHEYNDNGYVVKELGYYDIYTIYTYDNDDNLLLKENTDYKTIYEYDSLMRPTRQMNYWKSTKGEILYEQTTYDYTSSDCACTKEYTRYYTEKRSNNIDIRSIEKFDDKGRQIAYQFQYSDKNELKTSREEYHEYDCEDELITHIKYNYPDGENRTTTYEYRKNYDYDVPGSLVMNNIPQTNYKLNETYIYDNEESTMTHDIYHYSPVCFDLSDINEASEDGTTLAYPIAYYDLNGRKLSSPQQGMMIVKMSDGSAKKVMMK